jgi:hypothetical protein
MRWIGTTFLCAGLLLTAGCGWWRPTLWAAYVSKVPLPNGRIETDLWNKAKPMRMTLERSLAPGRETRRIELRAIHDGRAISILASWPDTLEAAVRRTWTWNDNTKAYQLEQKPVDSISLLWPLQGGKTAPDVCMLNGRPAAYDCWRWIAGWTNVSGVADDGRLYVDMLDKPTDGDENDSGAYRTRDKKHFARVRIVPDAGRPGSIPSEPPSTYLNFYLPGVVSEAPDGSAADVLAQGVYNRANLKRPKYWYVEKNKRTPGYWFDEDPHLVTTGFYFVEFYRLLVTATKDDDYPLRGPGPHWLAVSIGDEAITPDHYASKAFQLKLEPRSDLPPTP